MTMLQVLSTLKARPRKADLYYRHRLPVRIMHWVNVVCLTVLFMSGLSIFNAHSALYWGNSSYDGRPALLEITSTEASRGILRIGAHEFDTTGFLGVSRTADGALNEHAFP